MAHRGVRGRWTYVPLIAASVVLFAFDVAGHRFADDARRLVTDLAAPALGVVSATILTAKSWVDETRDYAHLGAELERLRAENRKLRGAERRARELEARTRRFETMLKLQPDPGAEAISARAIADARSPYSRTLIVNAGNRAGVAPGNAVLGAEGFIGRVIATGETSSRVLLVNDIESRIPVHVGAGRHRAILAGTNTAEPTLLHVPAGANLSDGDLVVTSGEASLLPPDLPIGEVQLDAEEIAVALASDPASVEFVRIVKYRLAIDVADGAPPLPALFVEAAPEQGIVAPLAVQAVAVQASEDASVTGAD